MEINLTLKQQQSLSQAQIQSLNILSFDSTELNEFLRNEYLENPLLEYTETFPAISDYHSAVSWNNLSSTRQETDTSGFSDNLKTDDASLSTYLLHQLDITQYSKAEWNLLKYLIHCLDDNGYFPFSIHEIASQTNVDETIISHCLENLRSLEPVGIFSSGLTDCLIRQLDAKEEGYPYMKAMILHHLDDIAHGRISSISRALHLPTISVRKYMERIQALNPKPLSGYFSPKEVCIIPDIIFTQKNNQWEICLNDKWIENYHLNDYYIQMLKSISDKELASYFSEKLSHLQFIFACIEQRRKSLLSIAKQLLIHQEAFFLSGENLKPMTMSSMSEELGIHPSTLSRAIKGKYIQYPKGSILCRDLFCTAVSSAKEEGSFSKEDIKNLIQTFICSENKKKPYSDQHLVRLFQSKGIPISRRAITKYRQEMGIGSSVDRKEDSMS